MIPILVLGFGNSISKRSLQWARQFATLNQLTVNTPKMNCQIKDAYYLTCSSCRGITQRPTSKREDKFRMLDGVPSDYDLIYKAPMNSYVTTAQGASMLSLAMLAGVGAYEVTFGTGEFLPSTMIENHEQLILAISALIVANLSMLKVAFQYPLRIYNRNKEYISIFTGFIPTQTRTIDFKSADVQRVKSNSILPWRDSIFKINKKKVFILDHFFRTPADFTRMLDDEVSNK